MAQTVALAGGGFVTTWSEFIGNDDRQTFIQRFDEQGNPAGETIELDRYGLLVSSTNGTFMHIGAERTGLQWTMLGQLYDGNAAPSATPLSLASSPAAHPTMASVCRRPARPSPWTVIFM